MTSRSLVGRRERGPRRQIRVCLMVREPAAQSRGLIRKVNQNSIIGLPRTAQQGPRTVVRKRMRVLASSVKKGSGRCVAGREIIAADNNKSHV